MKLDLGTDEFERNVVPVILDQNTAMYSLGLYGGIGQRLTIRDGQNQPVTLEVIGLLKNSILQGDLLISEDNFLYLFPNTGGYRFFLIQRNTLSQPKNKEQSQEQVAELLESTLSDYGFDAIDARAHLATLLNVQNTYLSTFQSLGALGLLLGTVGLAVVQLRNVAQRRGELALMQASGIRRQKLVQLVLIENLLLLAAGLGIGILAGSGGPHPSLGTPRCLYPLAHTQPVNGSDPCRRYPRRLAGNRPRASSVDRPGPCVVTSCKL